MGDAAVTALAVSRLSKTWLSKSRSGGLSGLVAQASLTCILTRTTLARTPTPTSLARTLTPTPLTLDLTLSRTPSLAFHRTLSTRHPTQASSGGGTLDLAGAVKAASSRDLLAAAAASSKDPEAGAGGVNAGGVNAADAAAAPASLPPSPPEVRFNVRVRVRVDPNPSPNPSP